jgi:hypothetical protein
MVIDALYVGIVRLSTVCMACWSCDARVGEVSRLCLHMIAVSAGSCAL